MFRHPQGRPCTATRFARPGTPARRSFAPFPAGACAVTGAIPPVPRLTNPPFRWNMFGSPIDRNAVDVRIGLPRHARNAGGVLVVMVGWYPRHAAREGSN